METALILLGLAIPVSYIWLIVGHILMHRTIRRLREDVERLKARPAPASAPQAARTGGAATSPAPPASPWHDTAPPPADAAPARSSLPPPPADPPQDAAPPRSFVFFAENGARAVAWVQENWFVAVAALSLAMAGLFLVQYGIENGILSPPLRVLCALGFGGALIAGGEWVRRRGGDREGEATAFLPSAFAGAGIATLFSGILAARQLYGLIGPQVAFAALVAIAVLAILLGWIYGTFLTVVGIVGAVAAPFLVGGESDGAYLLFYYFALIAAIGLGVDAMKRSAWVSALGVLVPWIGAALLWLGSGSEHLLGFAVLVAAAATCIPTLSPRPAFGGAMTFRVLHGRGEPGWPAFPTRLSAASLLALAGAAVLVSLTGEAGLWLALIALAAALYALAFWLDGNATLDDIAVPVALAMLAAIGLHGLSGAEGARVFVPEAGGEPVASGTITALVGFGMGISAMAGWKSLLPGPFRLFWAAGAAVFAPAVVLLLAQFWEPMAGRGDIAWAIHVMAVAALMTLLAGRTARVDGGGGLGTALFVLAGLNMLAFAMSVVLTETALTLGFALIVASAAWLDRRFDLAPVGWFVQLGILACGFRLVVDPGLPWALDAPLWEIVVAYAGTVALLTATWLLLRARGRTGALIVAESAIWSLAGLFVCLLLYRALDTAESETHWSIGLFGTIWLITGATQLWRVRIGGALARVRLALGAVFGGVGLALVAMAATLANPLFAHAVVGPPILDSLAVAYLLPAALLAMTALRFDHLDPRLRIGTGGIAVALAVLYVGLEIRRLWLGPVIQVPGVADGELYSYTIALLLTGAGLLLAAFLRRSAPLRKAGVAVVALTVAKVFLVDMAGLEGLIRVLSFLALGLSLAGLALVNRWITARLAG